MRASMDMATRHEREATCTRTLPRRPHLPASTRHQGQCARTHARRSEGRGEWQHRRGCVSRSEEEETVASPSPSLQRCSTAASGHGSLSATAGHLLSSLLPPLLIRLKPCHCRFAFGREPASTSSSNRRHLLLPSTSCAAPALLSSDRDIEQEESKNERSSSEPMY